MDSNSFYSLFYLYNKHKQLRFSNPMEAYLQYKDFKIDLINGKRVKSSLIKFLDVLDSHKISDEYSEPIVIHLFYELGYQMIDEPELIDSNKPLAIYIRYSDSVEEDINEYLGETFSLESLETIRFESYHQKFKRVYNHLVDGDCYQLNLTIPFYMRPSKKVSPEKFVNKLWQNPLKIGAYAHATYIDSLGKLFVSNSPECLFQVCQEKLEYAIKTMPIKGTVKVETEKGRERAWEQLVNSKKDEAELYMITDLMRNDLTKIELNPSKVIAKKRPLNAPGIIHQFSILESKLSGSISLKSITKNLFPGGSITGAPKKKVMGLIKKIETDDRGFYCGSTILMFRNIKTASINIRSAEVDYIQDEIKYGAGGGITLLSQGKEEFDEVLLKLKSFLLLLR
jgi:anthranilate/para-aminobenzoate synthase component I